MCAFDLSRCAAACLLSVLLAGCASTQLNYNTLDIASSVDSIFTRQALENLSKTIDDPNALPAQLDLLQGTIQTSASVTPSISFPLSQSITNTTQTAATVTRTHTGVLAGAGSSISGVDAWQQNWNVVPISDANTLRNLRALYRYVIYPDASLLAEYTVARVEGKATFGKDPYALAEPQCVLCSVAPFSHSRSLYINKSLKRGWLYWTTPSQVTGEERPPPADRAIVDLGSYGRHRLFMSADDYAKGYLSDFVLFLLPVAPLASTAAKPGSVTGQGRAAPSAGRGPYVVPPSPSPPGIVPPP
jgi:hypothetical protein